MLLAHRNWQRSQYGPQVVAVNMCPRRPSCECFKESIAGQKGICKQDSDGSNILDFRQQFTTHAMRGLACEGGSLARDDLGRHANLPPLRQALRAETGRIILHSSLKVVPSASPFLPLRPSRRPSTCCSTRHSFPRTYRRPT